MNDPTPRKRFPLARRAWKFAKFALRNWRERHRHPFNFGVHLLGIPMTLVALGLLPFLAWPQCLCLFAAGYFLQYLGHRIEGNDIGELIPLKRLLGFSVVAVVPRPQLTAAPKPD